VKGHIAMEMSLINRERKICVMEPEKLSGITFDNPVLSPTLGKFYDYANRGWWRRFGFEFLSFLSVVVLALGIYIRDWKVSLAAISFYIVDRLIHRRDE
jgi:MFS-type transporter involved in bile tolerance (Atg22 family)